MDSPTEMDFLFEVLRCPRTGQKLHEEGGRLVTEDGKLAYRMDHGIPVLLPDEVSEVLS
ncbi:MAG: Trm112 family protein [Chthoniobacterales bacterium]|nr:Trm112 family protein [Chthoniobacterales bacterium]